MQMLSIVFLLLLSPLVLANTDRADKKDISPTFLSLERHKKNYFISGDPNTKVQVSFKIPVVKKFDIYFGYSQLMFWELLEQDSSPFSDINFNPEIFYRRRFQHDHFQFVDFGTEHQSNGQALNGSRSWNRIYLYLPYTFQWRERSVEFAAKAYKLYDVENAPVEPVKEYQGYFELYFATKNLLKRFFTYDEFYITYRPGSKYDGGFNYAGIETGLRLKILEKESAPHFFLQWYNGYGETQLNYYERSNSIRAGISI